MMRSFLIASSVTVACARQFPDGFMRESSLQATDAAMAMVDQTLWDGGEINDLSLLRSHARAHGAMAYGTAQGEVERGVHVLGLQNTGTNLLFSMFMINFGPRVALYDFNYAVSSPSPEFRAGIWKHSNIKVLHDYNASALEFATREKVVAIMLVRDPMSWLTSMRKAPYEMADCVDGVEWLTKSCSHRIPAGFFQAPPMEFTNMEDMWGKWTDAYDQHSLNGFPEGIVVRYEDLVLKPELTMDMIAEKLGIEKPVGGWNVMDGSAKNHGESHGRLEAVEKINSRAFMDEYSASEVTSACSRLDGKLMAEHSYDSCSKAQDIDDEEEKERAQLRHDLAALCREGLDSTSSSIDQQDAEIILTAKAEALKWAYEHKEIAPDRVKVMTSSLKSLIAALQGGHRDLALSILDKSDTNKKTFQKTREDLKKKTQGALLRASLAKEGNVGFQALRATLIKDCLRERTLKPNVDVEFKKAIRQLKLAALAATLDDADPVGASQAAVVVFDRSIPAILDGRAQEALNFIPESLHYFAKVRKTLQKLATLQGA